MCISEKLNCPRAQLEMAVPPTSTKFLEMQHISECSQIFYTCYLIAYYAREKKLKYICYIFSKYAGFVARTGGPVFMYVG